MHETESFAAEFVDVLAKTPWQVLADCDTTLLITCILVDFCISNGFQKPRTILFLGFVLTYILDSYVL